MDLSASGMMDVTFVNDQNTFAQEENFTSTSTLHGEKKIDNIEQKGLQRLELKSPVGSKACN